MNQISHTGVVESIEGGRVNVRIVQTSACAACKVAGHCSAAESKEKVVQVDDSVAARRCNVGDKVNVAMTASRGRNAVILAFVIPFIVLVGTLVLCLRITGNEGIAALAGLGSLIPYYACIYLFRNKIARHFSFVIEN